MTVFELATALGRPTSTVYRWVAHRTIYVDRESFRVVPASTMTRSLRRDCLAFIPEWGGVRESGHGDWAFGRHEVAEYIAGGHDHVMSSLERFHRRFAAPVVEMRHRNRKL